MLATAGHVPGIVKQVYVFAVLHGEKGENPAADLGAASIATFVPMDRALSPLTIRLMAQQMESVEIYPTIPHDAARSQIEVTWKLATPLNSVDRRFCHRDGEQSVHGR